MSASERVEPCGLGRHCRREVLEEKGVREEDDGRAEAKDLGATAMCRIGRTGEVPLTDGDSQIHWCMINSFWTVSRTRELTGHLAIPCVGLVRLNSSKAGAVTSFFRLYNIPAGETMRGRRRCIFWRPTCRRRDPSGILWSFCITTVGIC